MTTDRYSTYRWKQTRRYVLQRDRYRCQLRLPGCTGTATDCEHLVRPEDGGGMYDIEGNLRASCRACNQRKRIIQQAERLQRHNVGPSRLW